MEIHSTMMSFMAQVRSDLRVAAMSRFQCAEPERSPACSRMSPSRRASIMVLELQRVERGLSDGEMELELALGRLVGGAPVAAVLEQDDVEVLERLLEARIAPRIEDLHAGGAAAREAVQLQLLIAAVARRRGASGLLEPGRGIRSGEAV